MPARTARLAPVLSGRSPGRHREQAAGLLMVLIGAGAISQGWEYGIGTLSNMGSGFFPVAAGAGLVLTGVLMAALQPPAGRAGEESGHAVVRPPDWRGSAAILLAALLFIALADRAGLAPATFACVFVGALGTRTTRLAEAALLAAAVAVFGVVLFRYGLQVPFPVVRGLLP